MVIKLSLEGLKCHLEEMSELSPKVTMFLKNMKKNILDIENMCTQAKENSTDHQEVGLKVSKILRSTLQQYSDLDIKISVIEKGNCELESSESVFFVGGLAGHCSRQYSSDYLVGCSCG